MVISSSKTNLFGLLITIPLFLVFLAILGASMLTIWQMEWSSVHGARGELFAAASLFSLLIFSTGGGFIGAGIFGSASLNIFARANDQ
jgi:hypothetical protein